MSSIPAVLFASTSKILSADVEVIAETLIKMF